MKTILLLVLLVLTSASAGSDWLAYVEYGPDQNLASVAATGLTVIFELEKGCLVKADAAELARLSSTITVRNLDPNPEGKLYLYIMSLRGPLPELTDHGVVLHVEDPTDKSVIHQAAVIKTDEQNIPGLNNLPVELARISLRPIFISEQAGQRPPLPAVDDSLVRNLVELVSPDSVEAAIQRLQDFRTRYSLSDSMHAAMRWIHERFETYGCDTVFEFPFKDDYAPNVIGIRYGKVNPQRIYGICGHADAITDNAYRDTLAPGADDNASGTTAVLEAARVFQDVDFENTVYFMAFSGEEQGLFGSDSFAEYRYRRRDSIKAVLNFDMISHGREGLDSLRVIGKRENPACAWLVDFYIEQADEFTDLKTRRVIVERAPNSDHHPFWERGYPALHGFESDFTPEYHTIGDTIGPRYYRNCGTNNIPLATNAIRAGVATIARLAGAMPSSGIERQPAEPIPAGLITIRPGVGSGEFRLQFSAPPGPDSRLTVYDAGGRLVRTIAVAGRTMAIWDGHHESGSRAVSGSYFFRLTDGAYTTTLRAVLLETTGRTEPSSR